MVLALGVPPGVVTGSTPPSVPSDVTSWPFPTTSGSITVAAGDLFVLHTDGDLWAHPGLLSGAPGRAVRLVDNADPRPPVSEGPGPNVIDTVSGPVDGVLYLTDCCEPAAGNLLTVDAPGAKPVAVGSAQAVAADPTGTRLGFGSYGGWGAADLRTHTQQLRIADPPVDGAIDAMWTADGTALAVMVPEGQGSRLRLIDPATLAPVSQATHEPRFAEQARFSGRAPDGSLLVTVASLQATDMRAFRPTDLGEVAELRRSFPPTVSVVRITADGLGLLWVDGSDLMYEDGRGDVRRLLSEVLNVWTPGA